MYIIVIIAFIDLFGGGSKHTKDYIEIGVPICYYDAQRIANCFLSKFVVIGLFQ